MKTKIAPATSIDLALSFLKDGEPIVFPTETVYGLGASPFQPKAIARIFAIKNRPPDNPLITHVATLEQALLLVENPPASFFLLAHQFWPGPLALIVKRKASIPPIAFAGHPTIAIRCTAHLAARALIEAFGEPLAAPSANLSGRPSPTTAQHAFEDLQGKVPLILDAGPSPLGLESTVLNLLSDPPTLLRPGPIPQQALENALKQPIALPSPNQPFLSPGMKYRHYAPKAKVRLVFDLKDLRSPFVLSPAPAPGQRLLAPQTLYAEFRRADSLGLPEIDVYCDAAIQADPALMNRLLRASEAL